MEVLYHIRDIPLHRPYIDLIYGRYHQFRFLKWPLNILGKLRNGYLFISLFRASKVAHGEEARKITHSIGMFNFFVHKQRRIGF